MHLKAVKRTHRLVKLLLPVLLSKKRKADSCLLSPSRTWDLEWQKDSGGNYNGERLDCVHTTSCGNLSSLNTEKILQMLGPCISQV